jgi:ABC-type transport system involved in cytochrome bd biosynthesis fused ATPase/permease subunit
MNGAAATGPMFSFFDLSDASAKAGQIDKSNLHIRFEKVPSEYEPQREVIQNVAMEIPRRLTSIVLEWLREKYTHAVDFRCDEGLHGDHPIGDAEVRDINESSLMSCIVMVTHNSHIFKRAVRSNLLIADPLGTGDQMCSVLK